MKRTWIVFLLAMLVAAACSSDDSEGGGTEPSTTADAAATTAAGPTTTEAPTDTTATPATQAATTTAAPATTTTTTILASSGSLQVTQVVFEPGAYVLVTNVGGTATELGGHWICRRPSYKQLPSFTLEPGDTVAIGLGDTPPPDLAGLAGVIDLGRALGPITRSDGEIGLFTGPNFDSADAIVDYVQWGSAGHGREAVAAEAGIWTVGAFVEVPEEAISISSSGIPGAGVEDWFADVGG